MYGETLHHDEPLEQQIAEWDRSALLGPVMRLGKSDPTPKGSCTSTAPSPALCSGWRLPLQMTPTQPPERLQVGSWTATPAAWRSDATQTRIDRVDDVRGALEQRSAAHGRRSSTARAHLARSRRALVNRTDRSP